MQTAMHLEDMPYRPDSCEYFECLRDLPGAVFLDSSFPHSSTGRFDILSAEPLDTAPPQLADNASEAQSRHYFDELKRYHAALFGGTQPAHADIPFCGGILGALTYDSGNALQALRHPQAPPGGSNRWLAAYDWCLVQDHLRARAVLVTLSGVSAARRADLQARLRRPGAADNEPSGGATSGFRLTHPFTSNLSEAAYREAFQRIQDYIHAGDCYQVNLAQRFTAHYEGDPWRAYRSLRAVAAAPFSAFLPANDQAAIVSLSPERFLALQGRHVETSPIKGTRPRHADARADELAARELRASPKERAENLMIV
ncbi:MAG: chorismate-binding protein, partial [Halioglobus sp.]|nr:chorismate-binding protein [Halioglobus sp.]